MQRVWVQGNSAVGWLAGWLAGLFVDGGEGMVVHKGLDGAEDALRLTCICFA